MRPDSVLSVEPDELVSLDEYDRLLTEYGEHELLTAEEEIALAKRIERGDLEAKEELITKNLRLVIKFASAYQHHGRPSADNIANGVDGLIRAVEKYDWRRGYKFSTYAVNWIRQSVRRAIDNQQEAIRVPVHLEERMRKINRAQENLEGQLGREPTVDELAEAIECEVGVVEETLADRLSVTSLDEPVGEPEESTRSEFIPDSRPGTAEEVSDRIIREQVRRTVCEELPPEEQVVIEHLYYNGHKGSREAVAEALELSVDEVKSIESRAFGRLSERLTGEPAHEASERLDLERDPETMDELRDAVWNYKTYHPEISFAEIGRKVGISARRANSYYRTYLKLMPTLPD